MKYLICFPKEFLFFLRISLSHLWHSDFFLRKVEVCILLVAVFLGLLQERVFIGFPHAPSAKRLHLVYAIL